MKYKSTNDNSLVSGGKGTFLISLPCKIIKVTSDSIVVHSLEEADGVVPKNSEITIFFETDKKSDQLSLNDKIVLRFLNLEKSGSNYSLYLESPNTIEKDGIDLFKGEETPNWPPSSTYEKH